jgi:DNA-directed RNA polymerase specialized sigma24 family protein
MDYDDERHAAAIGALPTLWRTLFRLHNFYGVDIALMANTLATDEASILACLNEARTMIDRQFPIWERQHPMPPSAGSPAICLEQRLRLDYRASVEASFAEGGYAGAVLWPAFSESSHADEEAAALFILTFLRQPLQMAYARSAKPGVAMIDLRRHIPSWRWVQRRRLREIASEIYCSGLRSFELWLAYRISPDLHYPSRLLILPHRRRALPKELDPRREGYHMPYWPNDAAKQQRFDRLPAVTQHVAALTLLYGRSHYEIARRLGISRRSVARHHRSAIVAIAFRHRRPMVKEIVHGTRLGWRLLRRKARKSWAAPHR